MDEVTKAAIAETIARSIMKLGDDGKSKCRRLQFMGGDYPANERAQGGLCETALVSVIEKALREFE